jgi:hypothetical protein
MRLAWLSYTDPIDWGVIKYTQSQHTVHLTFLCDYEPFSDSFSSGTR